MIHAENVSCAPDVQIGDARIIGQRVEIGAGVRVADGAVLIGDEIVLEAGTVVGRGCELRANVLVIGEGTHLGEGCRVLADEFRVGRGGRVSKRADIVCRSFVAGPELFTADEVSVGYGTTMEATSLVRLGRRVLFGPRVILNANHPITFGDRAATGAYTALWTHGYHPSFSVLDGFSADFGPISVGDDCWLGYHTTVLAGVSIGRGTLVASGAVVTRNLDAGVLAAGVPAKPVRSLIARPVDDPTATAIIRSIVSDWMADLAWKGWQPESCELGDGVVARLHQAGTGNVAAVCVLDRADAPRPTTDTASVVVVSLDDRPELDPVPAGWAVFEIRSRRCRGQLSALGHDLRNYLRRATLHCDYDAAFESILPPAIEQLLRREVP